MKKLYYQSCSYATPHIGVLINSIKNSLKNGDNVVFAYCDGIMTSCFKNISANSANCKLCNFTYQNVIKLQLPKVRFYPIKKVQNYKFPITFNYQTIDDIKQIQYRGVYIGLSVLSLYFTLTRNIEFEITNRHKVYFDYIFKECCMLTDQAIDIIDNIKPDCIAIYNGRYYENRMFYDIAMLKGLKFESNEVVGGFNEPLYPVIFNDCLPHDVHFFAKKAKDVWNQNPLDEQTKISSASSFFEKKRKGLVVCDKAYVKDQKADKLPELHKGKKSIVVFNSSSDEIAAIGGEWDSTSLFSSQYEAISFILEHISEDSHIYLRIHPNLRGINHSYHTDLYKLEGKYNNITIIAPEDTVSSYALLDIADKVVTFGSTMGVEACYWGKPVVLIGNAFYIDLEVCYPAKSKKDLISLLTENLIAKNKQGALYYSNYLLDRKYRTEYVNEGLDMSAREHNFLGKHYKTFSYHKLFGSENIYKLVEILYRVVLNVFIKDKNKFIR